MEWNRRIALQAASIITCRQTKPRFVCTGQWISLISLSLKPHGNGAYQAIHVCRISSPARLFIDGHERLRSSEHLSVFQNPRDRSTESERTELLASSLRIRLSLKNGGGGHRAKRCFPLCSVLRRCLAPSPPLGYFDLPSISSLSTASSILAFATCFPNALDSVGSCDWDPFISVLEAFASWDATGLGLSYRHQAAEPTPRRTMQRHPSPAFLLSDRL
jgi:hypothetical protein